MHFSRPSALTSRGRQDMPAPMIAGIVMCSHCSDELARPGLELSWTRHQHSPSTSCKHVDHEKAVLRCCKLALDVLRQCQARLSKFLQAILFARQQLTAAVLLPSQNSRELPSHTSFPQSSRRSRKDAAATDRIMLCSVKTMQPRSSGLHNVMGKGSGAANEAALENALPA